MNETSKSKIAQLSPAAARLLLSYLYTEVGDSVDDIVQRAGIEGYETFVSAKQQLAELGFYSFEQKIVHSDVRSSQTIDARPESLKSNTTSYSATVQRR